MFGRFVLQWWVQASAKIVLGQGRSNTAGARPTPRCGLRRMEAVADDARLTAHLGYTQWVACNFLRIKKSTHSATPLPPNLDDSRPPGKYRGITLVWITARVLQRTDWENTSLRTAVCSCTNRCVHASPWRVCFLFVEFDHVNWKSPWNAFWFTLAVGSK